MSKRNIFLIFALLVLICSIDIIVGNTFDNLKKVQKNNLDTKFSRKLGSPGRIIVAFKLDKNNFDCGLGSTFKKNQHPSRKFVSDLKYRIGKDDAWAYSMGDSDKCYNINTGYDYLFYFSEETNSLEDIFGSGLSEEFKKYLCVVDLTEFDISVVTSFKNAFSNLPNLQIIIFPTNTMTKPNDVTEMLKECTSLTSVDLSMFNISVVTSFKNAFSNSPNLQRIILPTKIMTKPKDVTEMLKDCTSLTSVDLSMFDLTDCENFKEMINGCNALNTLILHGFYFKNKDVVSNILSKNLLIYNILIYMMPKEPQKLFKIMLQFLIH